MKNDNEIRNLSFEFALDIVKVYKFLQSKNEYVLSKQLLRSGTSIGANVEESQAAQSKKDFISKLSIANKEARESLYWLKLLKESDYLNNYPETENLFRKNQSIINILTKIIKTLQNK
ncbi:MAG: four helix bundle protein [Nautiliaceae bacterium]